MRPILLVLGLLAVAALPPAVAALDQPSEYTTLLASLKAGKTDIDYARLRLSYMDSPEYKAAKDVSSSAKDKAEFHRAVFLGLVGSILNSGDGKSTEKAWVVITVHEEYVVLRVLGFRPSEQSVSHVGGHSFDVMKVKNVDDGTEQTFYFNVDIPFKHYGI